MGSAASQKLPLLAPITGALMGFALPACECGNVPVARRLLASGAPMGTAFGFLFAAPVLNPIVLASTWAAFPRSALAVGGKAVGSICDCRSAELAAGAATGNPVAGACPPE